MLVGQVPGFPIWYIVLRVLWQGDNLLLGKRKYRLTQCKCHIFVDEIVTIMIVCVFIKYVIMLKIIQKMSSKIWLRNIFYYWLFKGTVTWHLGTGGDRWINGMGGVSKVSGRKHLVGKSKLFEAGDLLKFPLVWEFRPIIRKYLFKSRMKCWSMSSSLTLNKYTPTRGSPEISNFRKVTNIYKLFFSLHLNF